MANLPVPKSYEVILGDMFATYTSKIGVNDLNVGSAVTSFFETMAQAIYRASGDTFSILRDFSVDRAEGEALKRLAREERVFPEPARVATGKVTISDTSFTKKTTKIYAGTPSPNIGSMTINASDLTDWPVSGSVYIGRGTSNIEGPVAYSSITVVGSYYILNLSQPTTKFHNTSESIILSQGGVRTIAAGENVRTIAAGASPNIVFTITKDAIILDGETEIANVPVAAVEPGVQGNVPRNAIKEFVSEPFAGAAVTNPSPFTTGIDEASDEDIRISIKKARISKGLGTAIAVKNSVLGARAADENAVVTSNEMFSDGEITKLFIDNGQGYEEKTEGVGLEYIIDSALGGERYFQLTTGGSQTSIAKAFLQSSETAPFNIYPNDRLAILVGDVLSEHVFQDGDFRSNGFASAFEVVASVNADSDLDFSARTINNGTGVSFSAKEESREFLKKTDPTVGNDAGDALGLSLNEVETIKLYKNKQPLTRNGRAAIVESENQNDWSATIISGDTLIVSVDNTAEITYSFVDNDFLSEGSYATVSKNNSLQSWINVINSKVTGLTASINGNRILLTSNLGFSARAKIEINLSSTLVSKGMFTVARGLVSSGREADFTLSRNTTQFKLTNPLAAGDSLTAGSEFTQGFVSSGAILGGSVTLASDALMWFVIDDQDAEIINHGVTSDSIIHFTKEAGNIIRFRSDLVNAFGSVQAGDYAVIWSEELLSVNRLEGRVLRVGASYDYFDIKVTAAEWASAVAQDPITFLEGLAFIRSETIPQKIKISAGALDINTIAEDFSNQLIGATASTENNEIITITTNNKDIDGGVLIFTFNDSANSLNFTAGDFGNSSFSHYGFFRNADSAIGFPYFIHSYFTSDRYADTPTSFIPDFDSAINLTSLGVDPNVMVGVKHPYLSAGLTVRDAQSADAIVQVDDITGTLVDVDQSEIIRRLRISDRYYLLQPLDFDFNDNITVILDNDPSNKTFFINLFRRAITNTTQGVNANSFRAYDVDSGATTEFEEFFGSDFNFKNYKALMRAKNVIDPTSLIDEDAILYRSAMWGKTGERFNVGYVYPTAPNQDIASFVTVEDLTRIRIGLKSGASVGNNIDGTTEWDITINPNTPIAGIDEISYTYNGTGTNPNMTTLAPGHYVTVNNNGEFSSENQGTFRICAATSTSFTVRRPSGSAVAENNIATLTTNTIALYENEDTTAQEIVDYVNDNLTSWVEAEIIDDSGSTGAGVISLSTYEDNDFVSETDGITLLDGINWISLSNLPVVAPNPQFTFKRTLSLPNFDTNTPNAYAFNNEEEIRLIPTTIVKLVEFLSIFAVTGLKTLGVIDTAIRDRNLQFSTQRLGSAGAVKVSGGTANNALAPIVGNAFKIQDTDLIKANILSSVSGGFNADSWVKLSSAYVQKKTTGISFTTNVTIVPNTPLPTTSTIELGNRDIVDRYFGQPRNHFRSRNRAFQVEKQGSLVNISWDEITGSDPIFSKTVEFNDVGGGNMSVNFNEDFFTTEYIVQSGDRNFSEAQIGDIVTIINFADDTNNGVFTVRGVSDDGLTLSVDNIYGVTAISAAVAPGDIVITTGVEEGDTIEIAAPFSTLNQGKFSVIRRYLNSIYIDNPAAIEERVVVSNNLRSVPNITSSSFDVTVGGDMKIEVASGSADFSAVKLGDALTIGTGFNIVNRGVFMVTEVASNYVKVANSLAIPEAGVVVTGVGGDVLEAQIPAILFSPYDNTRAGDTFVISGNVLSVNNPGSYTITEVLNKNKVVVSGVLTAQSLVQLNDLFVQVFVEEDSPYVGYKKIYSKSVDPFNLQRIALVFESNKQFDKINQSSGTVMTAQGKLGFSLLNQVGYDSYRYHTGLIAQANKIVYGDPRDNVTYPGVAAAGAEIFIEPPLVRRIEVSVNVRVQTGIPFNRITERVRNNIAALINSTPIGQSISISDIISVVNSISGVTAVSISSPTYDPLNDVIVVNPAEKPFILDIVNDIGVSKVG